VGAIKWEEDECDAPTTLISFSRLPEVVRRLPEVVFSKSRKQKAESGRQRSEDRGQKSEVGKQGENFDARKGTERRGKARKGAGRRNREDRETVRP